MEPANEIELFCPKCGIVMRITPEEIFAPVHCQNPLCQALIPTVAPQPRRSPVAEFYRTLTTMTPHAWVTPALIAANGIVFVLMILSGVSPLNPTIPELLRWGADFGPSTTGGQWWRLFTCMFVHIGALHILGNMYVLLVFGILIERWIGNIGYLLLYVISGLCGSLASLYWHPSLVSAGASGAIFGIGGGLVAMIVGQSRSIPSKALTQIRNNAVILIGLNLVYGFMDPRVDFAAHLGGLVSGFVIGLVLRQPLTLKSLAWRPLRNLIALGLGAVLVGGGVFATVVHHPDLPEQEAALHNFEETEKKCVDTYNSAVNKAKDGKLENADFANIIERDILPDWRTARERLSKVKDLPADLNSYVQLRQESWELLAKGLRTNDQGLMNQSEEKNKKVEAILKRMNEQRGK